MANQKETIVIDARMIFHSGIGVYLQSLIPRIKERFETVLLGNAERLKRFDWSENLKIIETKSDIYTITEQIELPRKIIECDYFWSPHYNIPVLPIKARRRIVTIHDILHLVFANEMSIVKRLYAKYMINKAVKISDTVLTVSDFSKNEIRRYTSSKLAEISVVYNGIDTKLFHKNYESEFLTSIKNHYDLPDKFILFVGNLKKHKNVSGLIQAYELILNNIKGVHLVIIGKLEGLRTFDTEIEELLSQNTQLQKRIVILPQIDFHELPAFYNLAEIFVFPSFYEGFGFPPLEAMACGCPVLVSNIEVLKEVYGKAAYYVNPSSYRDIARGIYNVLTDKELKSSLIEFGLQQSRLYDWDNTANQIINTIIKKTN